MMMMITRILMVCLMVMVAIPAIGQTSGKDTERIVLGSDIVPKDTAKQNRLTNRLIAPKGGWQCGLSVMYADFNSANSDYMLLLQGLGARASMLKIAPEAAYTFKNNHAVGVKFNYMKAGGMVDAATADLLGNLSLSVSDVNANSISMGGSVFQRTYIGIDKQGRFGIFWDYILGYTRSKTQFAAGEAGASYTVKEKINIAFAPGIVYFPMNNVSVQANISIADLSYATTKAYQGGDQVGTHKGWKAQAGLNLLNLSFGLTIHL
jgi:hypothetical protein